MYQVSSKIKSFRDLIAWREAHALTLLVYKSTKNFPREELFSLTDQIRRSSASVGANIAEGFSRMSYKEKIQFYSIALGSLTETENHIEVAKDLNYLAKDPHAQLSEQIITTSKLVNGLIKSLRLTHTT